MANGHENKPEAGALDHMMSKNLRRNDTLRSKLNRAVRRFADAGQDEDRTSSVHIHMPPSVERPNSMGAPPATVAKLEKWFPTTWRPWIRLGFLVLLGLATAFGYPVVQWLGKLAGAP